MNENKLVSRAELYARRRAKSVAAKRRHTQNRALRAALYQKFQGANLWNNAGGVLEWHRTLSNLSRGVGAA